MSLTIHNDDNLAVLERLAAADEKFDLIELDGPYGAGLEGWDVLDEDALLAHYTARLPLVARCLQPWGVSFLFGYPEGCAEIKAWARASGALHLRRWLTWYKQRTAHKGRKCETVLLLVQPRMSSLAGELSRCIAAERKRLGWTIAESMRRSDINAHLAGKGGGFLWFENGQTLPTRLEYQRLKTIFNLPDDLDIACEVGSYTDLTDVDFISPSYPEDTRDLNDAGLRSKPVGLYTDLFRPVVPPRDTKRALVLYGGSGNAAIAAGKLGYDVVCVEQDASRCEMIRRRWAWQVERRDETPLEELGPLFQDLV
jgi:hypothetical protein